MIINENRKLNQAERRRVREKIRRRALRCGSCGADDFEVGEALYMGFLFLDEDLDMHMVALTCKEPDCPNPRTGIKLRGAEFLEESR